MKTAINLNSFSKEKAAQHVSQTIKEAILKEQNLLIAIDGNRDISIIPKGRAEDIFTLMVLEFVYMVRLYKIADVDGILNCFCKNVRETFERRGE